jgi:Ca2+-binding EF-hand superfamily protein
MNARLSLLAAAGLALAWLAPAYAQSKPAPAMPAAGAHPVAPRPARDADAMSDAAFKAWDANRDGALSPAEFRAGMAALRRRTEASTALALRLRAQFDKLDGNGNGAIDAGEFGNLLLVRKATGTPALSAFDRNGDQRLDFAEYLVLVERLAPATRAAGKTP